MREINSFVNTDLSAFYFEIAKDLLYTGTQAQRSQVQHVLYTILRETLHWLAPVTPHLVQELCEHLPQPLAEELDPFRRAWERPFVVSSSSQGDSEASAAAAATASSIKAFDALSRAVKLAQEQARSAGKLGSGLACRVVVVGRGDVEANETRKLISNVPGLESELASLLVVSEVQTIWTEEELKTESVEGEGEGEDASLSWRFEAPVEVLQGENEGQEKVVVKVQVLPPRMSKCVRCWQYTAEDGETPCGRCRTALAEKGIQV